VFFAGFPTAAWIRRLRTGRARPFRAAHLRRDVERRADRDPVFLFMGYLVAGAADRQVVQKLHLASCARAGCSCGGDHRHVAIFATATASSCVVTLMGLLAFPGMLKAGYNVKVAAGA